MLTKEEYLDVLERLRYAITNGDKRFLDQLVIIEYLIDEYFELIDENKIIMTQLVEYERIYKSMQEIINKLEKGNCKPC